ncbi:DUF1223 domain-containing protein [Planctomycetota bacterium]|nr:DUF1223 domain-containing protein [Planctomycetota bacterium]
MRYVLPLIAAVFIVVALTLLIAPALTADEPAESGSVSVDGGEHNNAKVEALVPEEKKDPVVEKAEEKLREEKQSAQKYDDVWVTTSPGSTKPFALLQLFTSEGCSSCPPADRLLTQIREQAKAEEEPIYPLSFHVDYWNRLGWKDPYSSSVYSDLQKQYAHVWHAPNIYTPQMIVNGFEGFVGSNAKVANEQINLALTTGPQYMISLMAEVQPKMPDKVKVNWMVSALHRAKIRPLDLAIAITENDLASKVTSGENSGKTLMHSQVVRVYKVIPLTEENLSSSVDLQIPKQSIVGNTRIVAYIQDPETMGILGATRVDYPTPNDE